MPTIVSGTNIFLFVLNFILTCKYFRLVCRILIYDIEIQIGFGKQSAKCAVKTADGCQTDFLKLASIFFFFLN